jgi:SP family arabinose:H+ symporter-like MFS transporter
LTISGLVAGAFLSGFANKIGRWTATMILGVVVIIGCLLGSIYQSLVVLCIGKFIQGAAAGGYLVFGPKFIDECSPKEYTGPLGASFQMVCCLGILLNSIIRVAFPIQLDL